MVSIWPWRVSYCSPYPAAAILTTIQGEDTSPASFEKALAALSVKISKSQLLLDSLRQRSRRFKALWTLYTSFAYLLCAIILGLVVGWRNWGAWEYSALAGSPLMWVDNCCDTSILTSYSIYLGRTALDTYYLYRIDTVSHRLADQTTERTKTIDKLKAATKYDSTQQLLEKYGGESPKFSPKPKAQKGSAGTVPKAAQKDGRTSVGPPATANVPQNRPPPLSQPSTPQNPQLPPPRLPLSVTNSPASGLRVGPPEFAPNAFSSVPQYDTSDPNPEGNWYDRILDLILGDDETSAKNRVVLICENCRLVNGQAPPGVKRLEDIGKWRCIGCGTMNGKEDEASKIVEEMKEKMSKEVAPTGDSDKGSEQKATNVINANAEDGGDGTEVEDIEVEDESPVKKLRRGRSKKGDGS
jgi:hypothetical protein